jgi:hypothetical protein
MRVTQIDGVPIPADWPQVRANSNVRAPAAVEVARSLISPSKGRPHRLNFRKSSGNSLPDGNPEAFRPTCNSSQHPPSQAFTSRTEVLKNNLSKKCVTLDPPPIKIPSYLECEAEIVLPANSENVMKSKNKFSDAIETARKSISTNGKSSWKKASSPIQFERSDIDEKVDPCDCVAAGTQKLIASSRRRGRPRKQAPAELRKQMPEHGDDAYFEAQAQLRRPGDDTAESKATVPPSDYHHGGPRLTSDEIEKIVDLYTNEYGPILRLDEAAEITKLSKQTLRRKVCEGKFATSVYRGTPLRFITKRLLEEVLG